MLHSIIIDPRDANHMYLGLSGGGVFETNDRGADWHAAQRGLGRRLPTGPRRAVRPRPHCVQLHPLQPDRLYQQNHCGIYRLDRPTHVGARRRRHARDVGDIGFPIALHPRDPDTFWVFPMDGTDVWPRTSPDGRPAVYVTHDAGGSWERQDSGLPERAWFTVKRQAMCVDRNDPVGVYFGTTSGEIWASIDEGAIVATARRPPARDLSLESADPDVG